LTQATWPWLFLTQVVAQVALPILTAQVKLTQATLP